ncbi:MAG: hypothetical protein ACWGNV_00545 [Bacteroidales bacterium]
MPELQAQKSVYAMPFENPVRLSSMEAAINFEEIAATYQTVGNIYTTQITGVGEDAMEQTSTTHISDVKAVDAIRFLEFYLDDQLLDKSQSPEGMVEMSVVYYDEHSRWNPGTVLGVLTFGLALLMGVPYTTTIVDVELEASFFDDTQALTASHRGVGRGKRMVTMYTGSGNRKAHHKALKKALYDLNEQIMQDPLLTGIPPAGTP